MPDMAGESSVPVPEYPSAGTRIVKPTKHCFVTIGATASFRTLIDAVTQPAFIDSLSKHGYTDLDVQCGPDLVPFREKDFTRLADIKVQGFDFDGAGLTTHMMKCKARPDGQAEGVVISHAGEPSQHTSTAQDCMRHASHQAALTLTRCWFNSGCHADRRTAHRGAESCIAGQPPDRIGGRNAKTRICDAREVRVRGAQIWS